MGSEACEVPLTEESVPSRRCLIVEDQMLVALAIEAFLEEVGYDADGPLTTVADALAFLEDHTPDAVILDYRLKDGVCDVLADELRRRGVPFMVYSAREWDADLPEALRSAPWLEKPSSRDDLLSTLETLLPDMRKAGRR